MKGNEKWQTPLTTKPRRSSSSPTVRAAGASARRIGFPHVSYDAWYHEEAMREAEGDIGH